MVYYIIVTCDSRKHHTGAIVRLPRMLLKINNTRVVCINAVCFSLAVFSYTRKAMK